MLKETNLDGVKSVARMLLMTPVHKTPYSPAVVQHPFTSCGIAVARKDGWVQTIDITANEKHLELWQEWMRGTIEKAKHPYEIYMMTNKPYGLTFLKFAEPYLSKKDFSKILGDAWVRSENPNDDPNFTKRDLIAMFKRADKQALMTEEDYKRWQDLEKSITVYRGVTPHNEKNVRAMSWTLDAAKAEWFAMRFGENGKVYQAEIDKKDVYKLVIEISYKIADYVEALPRVGIEFSVDKKYSQFSYVGYGPHESYVDKNMSSEFGYYHSDARSNCDTGYVRPQESGSHYATEYLCVNGLFSLTAEHSFSFSVNPYTTEQLVKAKHGYELKDNDFVNICVDLAMRGIGSSSCGVELGKQYEIPKIGKNIFTFNF